MKDKVYIGPCPIDERGAQIGDPDFSNKNIEECRKYIDLIIKKFGEPPKGAKVYYVQEQHDFGSYREVVISYDENHPESVRYAFTVESESPRTWDDNSPYEWSNCDS